MNSRAAPIVTLSTRSLALGGSNITIAANASITTAVIAGTVLAKLDTSISRVNQALGNLGSQAKQIEAHLTFVSKLTDVLESGVGNLVDADLAKESARLQALQTKQQLGIQALAIANSSSSNLLGLFR